MDSYTKSVIVANDIVGLGKVALTTALPVLSACQIEVIPLPTVLLSSHTGGFLNPHITRLESVISGFLKQWSQMDISVDGLITGYFASQEQLALVSDFASQQQLLRFVDPIMGDHGCLYSGFQHEFVVAMRRFCKGAAVITPNLTEAALLTETPYLGTGYGKKEIEDLLVRLAELDTQHIILTGVSFEQGKLGVAYFEGEKNEISYLMGPAYPDSFFGTGDLLTAVLGAGYFHGLPMKKVIQLALEFLQQSIRFTLSLKRDLKLGLCYEPYLAKLVSQIKDLKEEKS